MPATTSDPTIQIEFVEADLLEYEGEVFIMPAFSDGRMVGGLALRVKKKGGDLVEELASQSAPIAVGAALVTPGGKLGVTHVIHAPIIEQAGMRIGVENIRRATRAGLLAATHFQFEKVAIPGMGYGEGGVPHDEAARAIIDEIRAYKASPPTEAVLLDTDPDMVKAFRTQLGE